MKTIKSNNRRKFLAATGLGAAGAVAAMATGTRDAAKPAGGAADGKKGYHVSDHILKYYKTTQV